MKLERRKINMERNKAVSLGKESHYSGNSYTDNPEESRESVDIMENTHTRNNNDTFFGLHLSDLTIKTSIDRMIISVNPIDPDIINSELKQHYDLIDESKPKGERYDHIINYKNELNKVSLLYSDKIYVRPLFIIHDPTPAVVDIFISVFKALDYSCIKNGINPKISLLELAWDFYLDTLGYLLRLKRNIDRHTFLFLQKQNLYGVEKDGTFYKTNVRRAVKGSQTRLGPEMTKKEYLRFEVELHRRKIRDLDITFPIRSHHLDIDFGKFFEFRLFDVEKFKKRTFKWNLVKLVPKKNDQTRRFGSSGGFLNDLLARRFEWMNEDPLMEIIERLKARKVTDYHHFLYPMENESRIIQQVADEQRFGFL
jgi:hypothetical protein